MLARNSTLQSMKKAARLHACTIVLFVLSKVDYPDKNPKTTITYIITYKSGKVLLTVLRTVEEIIHLELECAKISPNNAVGWCTIWEYSIL